MLVSDIIGPGWHRHADLASEVVGSHGEKSDGKTSSEIGVKISGNPKSTGKKIMGNGFGPENVGLIFPMIASHF